jgi:hypothetical protein
MQSLRKEVQAFVHASETLLSPVILGQPLNEDEWGMVLMYVQNLVTEYSVKTADESRPRPNQRNPAIKSSKAVEHFVEVYGMPPPRRDIYMFADAVERLFPSDPVMDTPLTQEELDILHLYMRGMIFHMAGKVDRLALATSLIPPSGTKPVSWGHNKTASRRRQR